MALYAVVAAKGSPGVTLTVMALAAAWTSPVAVADADVAGGDIAIRYRSPEGRPLDPDRGLVSLAASVRRGADPNGVSEHLQMVEGGFQVLTGVSRPEQVLGLGGSWGHLAVSLAAAPGIDVIADCGRALPGSPAMPLLGAADAVLFVTRPDLEGLFHLRERLRWVLSEDRVRGATRPVQVVVVADERDRNSLGDVQGVLHGADLPVDVLGAIAHDPKTATQLRYQVTGRKVERSMLMRSAASIAKTLQSANSELHPAAAAPGS